MVGSMFTRARLLVGAGVETAVSAAERVSGTSLMRHALRELDDAAADVAKQCDAARRRGVQLTERERIGTERIMTLGEQARFALREGRDELAESALVEQVALEERIAAVRIARNEAAADGLAAEQALVDLKARRVAMAADLKAYESAVASAGSGKTDRRVMRAEESFERVLAGSRDRAEFPPPPPHATEIDVLQRDRAVAERLAAMRAEARVEPSARKRGKRG